MKRPVTIVLMIENMPIKGKFVDVEPDPDSETYVALDAADIQFPDGSNAFINVYRLPKRDADKKLVHYGFSRGTDDELIVTVDESQYENTDTQEGLFSLEELGVEGYRIRTIKYVIGVAVGIREPRLGDEVVSFR
jgi:hypothetical protein